MYPTQVIVTSELSDGENLYLQCITNRLTDKRKIEALTADYAQNQDQDVYDTYMNYLATANAEKKGESSMCCEGIFRLYGTSSQEIAEKAAKEATEKATKETMEKADQIYMPQIQELEEKNRSLSEQVAQLQQMLLQYKQTPETT